jgi:hypothetical protein
VIAGDGLDELSNEETDFNVAAPTVDAGNLFEQTRIVQVHQHGLILLDGGPSTPVTQLIISTNNIIILIPP